MDITFDISVADLITAVVAVAGLILSCYSLYLRREDKKPSLYVKNYWGFKEIVDDHYNPREVLIISVANTSSNRIQLRHIAFKDTINGQRIRCNGIYGEQEYPCMLEGGENRLFWIDRTRLIEELLHRREIKTEIFKSVAIDGLGNEFMANQKLNLLQDQIKQQDNE